MDDVQKGIVGRWVHRRWLKTTGWDGKPQGLLRSGTQRVFNDSRLIYQPASSEQAAQFRFH